MNLSATESMSRSAEPGRKAAYSVDLRWRVVWQRLVFQANSRQPEYCTQYTVSLSNVQEIRGDRRCCTLQPAPACKPKASWWLPWTLCDGIGHGESIILLGWNMSGSGSSNGCMYLNQQFARHSEKMDSQEDTSGCSTEKPRIQSIVYGNHPLFS